MLTKRVITAVIGLPLLYLFISWGSIPFLVINIILIVVGLREYREFLEEKFKSNKYWFYITGIIFAVYAYLVNQKIIKTPLALIFLFIILFFFIYFYKKVGYQHILKSISLNLFGIIYTAGGLIFLIFLRDINLNFLLPTRALWLVLIATWLTDTAAYFTGRFLGKTKLIPGLSPNKTVEGAVGGIVFSALAIIIFALIKNIFSWAWFLFAILLPVAAIGGDLFESALKRDAGVKDSGAIVPGHGGILDRFDSLIFTLPLTYYFLLLG